MMTWVFNIGPLSDTVLGKPGDERPDEKARSTFWGMTEENLTNSKKFLPSTEQLLCARHYPKHFISLVLLNSLEHFKKSIL